MWYNERYRQIFKGVDRNRGGCVVIPNDLGGLNASEGGRPIRDLLWHDGWRTDLVVLENTHQKLPSVSSVRDREMKQICGRQWRMWYVWWIIVKSPWFSERTEIKRIQRGRPLSAHPIRCTCSYSPWYPTMLMILNSGKIHILQSSVSTHAHRSGHRGALYPVLVGTPFAKDSFRLSWRFDIPFDTALTTYDILLTFSKEVDYIWRRKISAVTFLYGFIRYGTLLQVVLQFCLMVEMPASTTVRGRISR